MPLLPPPSIIQYFEIYIHPPPPYLQLGNYEGSINLADMGENSQPGFIGT